MERSPRSTSAIVDEQVQRWLLQRSKEAGKSPDRPPPLITVSRQFGARGAELGHRVAERLGFSYWNRELLAEIARHAHTNEQVFAAFDEHHRAVIADTLSGIIPKPAVGPSDYFRELAHVVHDLARHGGGVVVGRGINFMLDPSMVLRLRVVASPEARVRGVMEREHLAEAAARAQVAEADRDRRDFVRDHYGREIDDPTAYDLWINTETISIPAAAEVVVAAYRGRFGDIGKVSRI